MMGTMISGRVLQATLATAVTLLICAGSPARAQSVAVMVNGEPITNFDIEQRTKLNALSGAKTNSRQDVIEELISEKVKIKEGKKYSVDPGASEVDGAFQNMSSRMRLTPDQLVQSLASKGIRPDTLKSRLKADMVWNAIVRGRFKQSLQVGEKEVDAAVQGAGGDAMTEAFEYQMRPVVLVVPRGAASGMMEARHKEAEGLRERIQSCEDANRTFKSMQNATIRDTVVEDLCRSAAVAARTARQDPDRTSHASGSDPPGRRNGRSMRAQADQGRYAEEAGSPRQDVCRQIRSEVEILPAGSAQSGDDRISVISDPA